MDIDNGASRGLATITQADEASGRKSTAGTAQSAPDAASQSESSTVAPRISVSAPNDGNELRYNQPFLAAHTGNYPRAACAAFDGNVLLTSPRF